MAVGQEPEADARHKAWRLSLAAHPARRSALACSLCLEPPGPATKPCSIIPRDAPGLWLPRKLLANAGAGGPGEQGAVSHLPCHRSQSSPRRMFMELSAGGDAGRSVFQYARLPALGAASEEQRGWLLCSLIPINLSCHRGRWAGGLELGFSCLAWGCPARPRGESRKKKKLAGANRGGGGTGSGKRKSDHPATVREEVGGRRGDRAGSSRAAAAAGSPVLGGKCRRCAGCGTLETELSPARSPRRSAAWSLRDAVPLDPGWRMNRAGGAGAWVPRARVSGGFGRWVRFPAARW